MGTWNSSPHPISDVKDWQTHGRLEIQPDFQRREVWSESARIMLIDTILRNVPMPKMFVWNSMVNGSTHRRVIDGQQRIRAILDFMNDKFALSAPYEGEFAGQKYSALPQHVKDHYLHYRIDFNEAVGFTEQEVREVYSRVNKYSLPLNRQELRQADYPGDFLDLSLDLSANDYLDESRIFSSANKRRMGDVEFISEILASMLEGPQDKKEDLDHFYLQYRNWNANQINETKNSFNNVLDDLKRIFSEDRLPLRNTRFRQKSDFYTLFAAVHQMHKVHLTLDGKNLDPLREDLAILDKKIAPESDVEMLQEYAIKCVSQANSQSSRLWRANFITKIIEGTYRATKPAGPTYATLNQLARQLAIASHGSLFSKCSACNQIIGEDNIQNACIDWEFDTTVFQISNACWKCGCESVSA